ncbi:hypothetical protein FRB99_000430, partial [Tulasnella sp. 403]
NCAPPANVPGHIVSENIRNAANQFGSIVSFKAYLELSTPTTSPKLINLRSELQSCGVSLTDCPRTPSGKDVVDKMLLVDMMAFALDNPTSAVVMLISGDRDFVYAVSVLRQRLYKVVVVIPPQGANIVMHSQANVVLDWRYDIFARNHHVFDAKGAEDAAVPLGASLPEPSIPISTARRLSSTSSVDDTLSKSVVQPTQTPILPLGKQHTRFKHAGSMVRESAMDEGPSTPREAHRGLISSGEAEELPTAMALVHQPANLRSPSGSPNGSGEGCILDTGVFNILIQTLEGWHSKGVDHVLRSQVGAELVKRSPTLYRRAGVKNFNEFVGLAEKAGVVRLGDGSCPGKEWVTLSEVYRNKTYSMKAGELWYSLHTL